MIEEMVPRAAHCRAAQVQGLAITLHFMYASNVELSRLLAASGKSDVLHRSDGHSRLF